MRDQTLCDDRRLDLAAVPLTMSSLEIAGLTGKRHDNVLRDATAMLAALGITALNFEASYQDSTGRTLRALNLPKRETLILVSGYSVEMCERAWSSPTTRAARKPPSHDADRRW